MQGIELKNIVKTFGEQKTVVLNSINLIIEPGDFVSLTGRSGSGKSTLLYMMSGLDEPSEGEVWLDGRNLHQLDVAELHEFRNTQMGFVFQFHYLLPELTSLENILMPARKKNLLGKKEKKAWEFIERFELEDCAYKKPSQMSGGQQQRVAIARALIMEPRYLFADEPTGNLDSVSGRIVMDILKQINRETNTTIVMVTHERDYAAEAKRQVVLIDGAVESDTIQRKR